MSTLTSTSTEQRLSMSPFSRPLSTKPAGLPASAIMNHTSTSEGESLGQSSGRHPSPTEFPLMNGTQPSDQWQSVRDNNMSWGNGRGSNSGIRHGRQKSLSDAFKTIRTRRASVSANAHEIAEALKAPISVKLIILCLIWYMSSAMTNTSSKSILNAFPKPITLTLIQFAFVSTWCMFFSYLAYLYPSLKTAIPALKHGIRYPTREVISATLPLAIFQIGGHILSSTATSKIPVSLVHTIKGLSPLFTVLAYRFVFGVHYATATYLSLIPLTLGVILACSVEFSGNLFGIFCAFGGAIIFVTQNIFSKKLFNEAARADADGRYGQSRRLDKLNLLFYCSGLAFLFTAPLWLWTEGFAILGDFFHDGSLELSKNKDALDHGRLTLEFIFNGIFHFGQNIIAFVLLSMVSPVTYSVASLIKRVFVIVVAIIWFGSRTTSVQAAGIALTFVGLYLYDRTSDAARADRIVKLSQAKADDTLLPLAREHSTINGAMNGFLASPESMTSGHVFPSGVISSVETGEKKDAVGPARTRGNSNAVAWAGPGTKQDGNWRSGGIGTGY